MPFAFEPDDVRDLASLRAVKTVKNVVQNIKADGSLEELTGSSSKKKLMLMFIDSAGHAWVHRIIDGNNVGASVARCVDKAYLHLLPQHGVRTPSGMHFEFKYNMFVDQSGVAYELTVSNRDAGGIPIPFHVEVVGSDRAVNDYIAHWDEVMANIRHAKPGVKKEIVVREVYMRPLD